MRRAWRAEALFRAIEEVSALEHRLRREQAGTRNGLAQILRQVVDDRSGEIAWMSVIDANGRVQSFIEPHHDRCGFCL